MDIRKLGNDSDQIFKMIIVEIFRANESRNPTSI